MARARVPKTAHRLVGRETIERAILNLVDSIRDYAILTLHPDGTVASWNLGAQQIKGYTAAEIIGEHFSRFYLAEDIRSGKPEQELTIAAKEGRFEDEGWRIRKDGSRFWANVVVTALWDKNGQIVGFGKVTRDLTDRKRLEDGLARQAREILELSTPVLRIRDQLLILPLIGAIDTERARTLTESLLQTIRATRARAAILDITGVPAVDSRVANHLVQSVEAARLMGAMVVVTGMSAEVAQALVTIGVDLARLRTVGDLQGGIEEVERLLGFALVRADSAAPVR